MPNPRKFSEKIALLTQKQEEGTAAYEAILREISASTGGLVGKFTSSTQELDDVKKGPQQQNILRQQNPIKSSPRGRSLINVNQSTNIDLQNALMSLKAVERSVSGERLSDSRKDVSQRMRARSSTAKTRDCSPYGSLYLSIPTDQSWRRTSSDSALHSTVQSADQKSALENSTNQISSGSTSALHVIGGVGGSMILNNSSSADPFPAQASSSGKIRPRSCGGKSVNIGSGVQNLNVPLHMSACTAGSLPDLSILNFPPPLSTPLDSTDPTKQQQQQHVWMSAAPVLHSTTYPLILSTTSASSQANTANNYPLILGSTCTSVPRDLGTLNPTLILGTSAPISFQTNCSVSTCIPPPPYPGTHCEATPLSQPYPGTQCEATPLFQPYPGTHSEAMPLSPPPMITLTDSAERRSVLLSDSDLPDYMLTPGSAASHIDTPREWPFVRGLTLNLSEVNNESVKTTTCNSSNVETLATCETKSRNEKFTGNNERLENNGKKLCDRSTAQCMDTSENQHRVCTAGTLENRHSSQIPNVFSVGSSGSNISADQLQTAALQQRFQQFNVNVSGGNVPHPVHTISSVLSQQQQQQLHQQQQQLQQLQQQQQQQQLQQQQGLAPVSGMFVMSNTKGSAGVKESSEVGTVPVLSAYRDMNGGVMTVHDQSLSPQSGSHYPSHEALIRSALPVSIPDIVLTGGADESGERSVMQMLGDSFDLDLLTEDDLRLGPLDLDELQMLTDPSAITDPLTEDSFRLDSFTDSSY